MEPLIQRYQEVLDLIQNVLKQQGMVNSQQVQEKNEMDYEISEDDFKEILNEVLGLVDEFEFDPVESLLDSLKTYRMRKEHMEIIEKLSEYMQELQVDEIKDLIQKWKDKENE